MGATKVTALEITNFRRFKDITIPIGRDITLIAGQNGTSKSTLLGMLAQPFSFGVVRGATAKREDASTYTSNYHNLRLHEYMDLAEKHFMYDCDDVFRLSAKHDFGKAYEYKTLLSVPDDIRVNLPNNSLLTKSRPRNKGEKVVGMRFVTGPGASHESGEGNYPHPVIYLGLNRLWPLAVSKTCKILEEVVSEQDNDWYVGTYKTVLCLGEKTASAKFMNTAEKKKFITPEGTDYDGESCSAGQDNLGQILTTILSFRKLKSELGNLYQGGMLLIDELDATLHAFAQDKLLEVLNDACAELDLQVVATTHSLRLIEIAYNSRLKQRINFQYFKNVDGRVKTERFGTYLEVSDHLKVESTPPGNTTTRKVSVLFEDEEARQFFQQICGSKLRNYISITNLSKFDAGSLKNLAAISQRLPELQNVIFVADGDMSKTWSNPPRNLIALPGKERPETLCFMHLHSMSDSDSFWKSISKTYTKQFAIVSPGGSDIQLGKNKLWVKDWFRRQSEYWGRDNQKAFKSWVQAHKKDCSDFCTTFVKLLKGKYKGTIPKDVIDRTFGQFKEEVPETQRTAT